MEMEEKLAMLEQLSGENNVSILSTYLQIARSIVMNRVYGTMEYQQFPPQYDVDHVLIAEYLLAKRGAEGELSHSENGVSRSYESGGVPSSLLRNIIPKGKVL